MERRLFRVAAQGFRFVTKSKPFTHVEDAFDYFKREWTVPSFTEQLEFGTLPEGLLVRLILPDGSYGLLGIVVGQVGSPQEVTRFIN